MNSNVVIAPGTIEDPKFDTQLLGVIEDYKASYKKKQAEVGELKATPFSRLWHEGRLTLEYLKPEFQKIANKTSDLPKSRRDLIGSLVFEAAKRTVLIKQAERAQRIAEKANARVEAEEAGIEVKQPGIVKQKGSKRKAKKLQKKGKK